MSLVRVTISVGVRGRVNVSVSVIELARFLLEFGWPIDIHSCHFERPAQSDTISRGDTLSQNLSCES